MWFEDADDGALVRLGVALALGMLVGLLREQQGSGFAGVRTFALVTLFGALCASLVEVAGAWVLPAGLLALAALLVVEITARLEHEQRPGPTTEIAALLMFAVGAALALLRLEIGVVVGGLTAVLLTWKRPLHDFASSMDEAETRSIARFALIGLIVLPVLPDRALGPFDVLNPFEIWLKVVLIVGISLASYLAHRILGARVGTLLAGVLGGLISSTATALDQARRSARGTAPPRAAALIILIASVIVFPRVLFLVAVLEPEVLPDLVAPLGAMAAWFAVVVGLAAALRPPERAPAERRGDPTSLWAAIAFGLLFAVVLVGVATAEAHLGATGLYAVAVLSGLTDMDAITLSTVDLVRSGSIPAATGWRMILVGACSNLAFKGLLVALLGSRPTVVPVAITFAAALAGAAAILCWWPTSA